MSGIEVGLSGRRQPPAHRGRAHQRDRLAAVQGADRRGEVRGGRRDRPRPGEGRRARCSTSASPTRTATRRPTWTASWTCVTRKVKVAADDRLDGRARCIELALRHVPGQGHRQLDQPRGRRGALRAGRAAAPRPTARRWWWAASTRTSSRAWRSPAQRKLAIAERSHALLTGKYGLPARDLIFDPLVFPVGTGDANYIGSAVETIEGIRAIKARFPECKTILGISNVSFGLPAGRPRGAERGLPLPLHQGRPRLRHRQHASGSSATPRSPRRSAGWPRTSSTGGAPTRWPPSPRTSAARRRSAEGRGVALPLDERLARYIVEGSQGRADRRPRR